jgi:hypothetical protein
LTIFEGHVFGILCLVIFLLAGFFHAIFQCPVLSLTFFFFAPVCQRFLLSIFYEGGEKEAKNESLSSPFLLLFT